MRYFIDSKCFFFRIHRKRQLLVEICYTGCDWIITIHSNGPRKHIETKKQKQLDRNRNNMNISFFLGCAIE